jgi:predicted CXXCH cytochrome family protein
MKKAILVLCLGVVIVFALSSVAYANTTSDYLVPTGSPHGAYTTSSTKCGVCHAVHKATPAGQILMRGTAADACTYCHITTATGLIQVYNGVATNYTLDNKAAHDAAGGAACITCHTPHGASALIADHAYLEEKILKGMALEAGLTVAAGDGDDVAVSKWCTNCHNSSASATGMPYYEVDYDVDGTQGSHVMTAPSADYAATAAVGTYGGVVAWTGSQTCRSCHADGLKNQSDGTAKVVASSYPHFTAGQRFLTSAGNDANSVAAIPATNSEADGVCIRCHVSAGEGAGITY